MYKLNYCKTRLVMKDIADVTHKNFGSIDITAEDMMEILNKKNQGLEVYVDEKNQSFYFLEAFNEVEKRNEIVAWRDNELTQVSYFRDNKWWHEVLTKKGVTIDDAYFAALKSYYLELLDFPQAYDSCGNKRKFVHVFVDEYSEIQQDHIKELVKPDFMK